MEAGDLRHRVELQRATTAKDAYGADVPTWATYASPWAEIKSPSARQAEQGKTFSDVITNVIRLRHRTDMLPSDRVKYGARLFYIEGITDESGKAIETLIYATERVD